MWITYVHRCNNPEIYGGMSCVGRDYRASTVWTTCRHCVDGGYVYVSLANVAIWAQIIVVMVFGEDNPHVTHGYCVFNG